MIGLQTERNGDKYVFTQKTIRRIKLQFQNLINNCGPTVFIFASCLTLFSPIREILYACGLPEALSIEEHRIAEVIIAGTLIALHHCHLSVLVNE